MAESGFGMPTGGVGRLAALEFNRRYRGLAQKGPTAFEPRRTRRGGETHAKPLPIANGKLQIRMAGLAGGYGLINHKGHEEGARRTRRFEIRNSGCLSAERGLRLLNRDGRDEGAQRTRSHCKWQMANYKFGWQGWRGATA